MSQKVIFDTDPGVDDALALYYLLRHPQIDLLGVTTVFGNAPIEVTTRNARWLLREWGRDDIPVHAGASATMTRDMADESFPTHIHGLNGLGDIPIDMPAGPVSETAARFIVETVRANPGQVRILAVGRMTNLARALALDPGIAGLVRDVVIMGGAFRVPGNITPAAEANIWGDAQAADIVFGARWPVTAIPLDLTTQTFMDAATLHDLARRGGEGMRLVAELSQDYVGFYRGAGYDGMLVHDCCAAVFLTDPDLFALTHGEVRVVDRGIALGLTIMNPEDRKGPPADWEGRPRQSHAHDGDAAAILARIDEVCTAR
ncbi:nucleoside hydrolase [Paracoccus sp. 1_MG-2023]|uniref:nucleoside hydrolase n=1 Tax=unclassified Paracoccus (in: a-proteobacteria) TaxID=2688777 RepID=UPI001C0A1595|nr:MULTISPECIES: nucleoside hydrolase [unclassified Paracoccus (in: a-proteobacteria)]MBU2957777.1 nucleoside hydrolase [Paracoccus sp. C2R09]MDO6667375.1 nucleoside hydrolase [Paracoccus sp. 1_MG-2023]